MLTDEEHEVYRDLCRMSSVSKTRFSKPLYVLGYIQIMNSWFSYAHTPILTLLEHQLVTKHETGDDLVECVIYVTERGRRILDHHREIQELLGC